MVGFLCMRIMIFIDHYCTKKYKKIGARPHAVKARKCPRHRLFYYLGLNDTTMKYQPFMVYSKDHEDAMN